MPPVSASIGDLGPAASPAGAQTDSLDPGDWRTFRALCHAMLDEAVDFIQGVRERQVWRPVPAEVKASLEAPLPWEGEGLERVCDDFLRLVLPYATGNIHPRFFGWVHGSGTASGMLAELLAGAMDANVGGREHGAVYVERQVLRWCRELFGFPGTAGGLLVSGTSMATLIGLTVARNHMAEQDLRAEGLGAAGERLVGYASSEAHGSVMKAFEILCLGRAALRLVPTAPDYLVELDALRRAIEDDVTSGHRPFCIIGNAGTVNTGAIDDLDGLADLAAEKGLWLHVEGAFGALAMLARSRRPLLEGLERADSLAFDFHKWLHVPYDAGCILVRREALQRQAFAARETYLGGAERGLAAGDPWFCEYGPELSRGFRALKVWFTLKEHGLGRLGDLIEANCRQARYLADRIADHPDLEGLAPVTLNIVCFRYTDSRLEPAVIDRINRALVQNLQEAGIAAPSTTQLGGKLAIRACICNHRTTLKDLDLLVAGVAELGRRAALQDMA
jgi:glutamate/tyrosine decarboxylase-like PLP-dependent enzyme